MVGGREPMARKPDMALFQNASGSLARREILACIFSKHCKTPNTSKAASENYRWCRLQVSYSSTEQFSKSVSNEMILWCHVIPISNRMTLLEIH